MNTKNNAITIWRIIFTYAILIHHFDIKFGLTQEFGMINGWYIGVEFFFIVSGYLLYTGLDKLSEKCHSGLDYFVYRYKKIYPYYLGAFLFSLICWIAVTEDVWLKDVVELLFMQFFEIFALHGIGLDAGWSYINNTTWFISVMFISGFIIYHCLIKWKDNFVRFVAPLIIMISFSYLYRNACCLDAVVETTGFYNNYALMRGLADMCLGIMAALLNGYIRANCKRTGWLRLMGSLGFVFVLLCSMKYGNSTKDFMYAMLLTVCVAIAFLPSEHKIFHCKYIHKWSAVTLCIYLVHDAFRTYIFPIFLDVTEEPGLKFVYLLVYMTVVTVFAIIFEKVVKWSIAKVNAFIRTVVS